MKNKICPYKISGFTLSEVLITLGIIGVVAALTVPSLVANYKKKQFKSGLNKGYSALLQALEMYKTEKGAPLTLADCTTNKHIFKSSLQPYLKVLVDCGQSQSNSGKTHPACSYNGAYSGKYTYRIYSDKNTYAQENLFDDGQLVLTDGSLLLFEDDSSYQRAYVSIDINGANKLPNQWGVDLFTFQLMDDGRLLPIGAEGTDKSDEDVYCSKTSTSRQNGIACTNRALYDKSFWE